MLSIFDGISGGRIRQGLLNQFIGSIVFILFSKKQTFYFSFTKKASTVLYLVYATPLVSDHLLLTTFSLCTNKLLILLHEPFSPGELAFLLEKNNIKAKLCRKYLWGVPDTYINPPMNSPLERAAILDFQNGGRQI